MKNDKALNSVLLALGFVIVTLLVYSAWFIVSRPAWQLTVRNSKEGVVVVATTEVSPTPVYTVEILGASIGRPFENLRREDITSTEVRTVEFDDTLKPGLWVVIVAGVKLRIMPNRIEIDQHLKGAPDLVGSPGESLIAEADGAPNRSQKQ